MDSCIYLSELFLHRIYPAFTEKMKTASSGKKYLAAVSDVCNHYHKDFLELSQSELEQYFHALQTGLLSGHNGKRLSLKTVSVRYSLLRSVSYYILKNQELFKLDYVSPFETMVFQEPSPYVESSRLPSLSLVDQLLEHADTQMRLILLLVVRCGLSTSELCSLLPSSLGVDYENRLFIRIHPGKISERLVKVPSDLRPYMDEYLAGLSPSAPSIFMNRHGNSLTERTLQRMFLSLMEQGGSGARFALQDFRNMAMAHMLRDGATPEQVARQVGVLPSWLFRYDHAIEDLELQASDLQKIRLKNITTKIQPEEVP